VTVRPMYPEHGIIVPAGEIESYLDCGCSEHSYSTKRHLSLQVRRFWTAEQRAIAARRTRQRIAMRRGVSSAQVKA
jgi:hypothetical protein